ncbi:MAG: DUF1788 domain-containing protein [Gallionella sp.]|jgi:hypothetical protein
MAELGQRSFQERFQHLLAVVSSERFLKMQSLNNEIPFYICPYKAQDAVEMERLQQQLRNKLDQSGIRVLNINLYDLSIDHLKREGDWDWYLSNEPSMAKTKLLEELQSMLDVESVVIPAIAAKMAKTEFDVMFIGGVGEVFPFIRSHNVLNNLQKTAKHKPTVMFFPGEYTHSIEGGAALELFGRLRDDKYYRAFNIFETAI